MNNLGAKMANLFLGIALLAIGMGIAYGIWNILLAADIVYISSKKVGLSQLIPVLATVPGVIVYIVWFMSKKAKGEATQIYSTDLYKFAPAYAMLVAFDIIGGVAGAFIIGTNYFIAGLACVGITVVIQAIAGFVAFCVCPPFSRR